MSDRSNCPRCGQPLGPDAPQGLCPACLLHPEVTGPPVEHASSGFESSEIGPTQSRVSPPSATHFSPPSVEELAKKFPQLEILAMEGRGGMGAVYKARQIALDRFVALKILPVEVGRDPAFRERFLREARALARLAHPNIVMVFEFGQADDLYYLLLEYVDGITLRAAMRQGRLTAEQALAIVPQICDALQYAHEEGVVHRDIKPENVLLDKRGRVKLVDFGLAKLLGATPAELTLTATHQVMGTLRYMAPEQIESPLQVDHRADIYSLGVVFYELLTGELPLGRFALPSERQMDQRLDEVVLKTLEHQPDRRYQQASEVKTDVERISRTDDLPIPPRVLPGRQPEVPHPETNSPTGPPEPPGSDSPRRGPSNPGPSNPGPSNPGPSNPGPSDPGPSGPGPSGPGPSGPGPSGPGPANPAFGTSAPGAIRLPFVIHNAYGGFATADGILRFNGQLLSLEYHLKDNVVGAISSPVRQVDVPLEHIMSLRLGTGLGQRRLFIQTDLLRLTTEIPNSNRGLVTVLIHRQDRGRAEQLVQWVRAAQQVAGSWVDWQGQDHASSPQDPQFPAAEGLRPAAHAAHAALADPEAGGRKVRPAAIGMLLLAILNLLPIAWLVLSGFSWLLVQSSGPLDAEGLIDRIQESVRSGPLLRHTLLLAVINGGMFLASGLAAWRLGPRALAIGGAVIGLIPHSPLWFVNFPLSIWFLSVLFQEDVRAAFDAARRRREEAASLPAKPSKPDQSESFRRSVRIPACGLLATGVLNGAVAFTVVGVAFREMAEQGVAVSLWQIALAVLPALVGSGLVFGAAHLWTLRSYPAAQAACILAVLPCTPVFLFSLPFGVLGLMRLSAPEVRRQFAGPEPSMG